MAIRDGTRRTRYENTTRTSTGAGGGGARGWRTQSAGERREAGVILSWCNRLWLLKKEPKQ
jgi:hypothetical protein